MAQEAFVVGFGSLWVFLLPLALLELHLSLFLCFSPEPPVVSALQRAFLFSPVHSSGFLSISNTLISVCLVNLYKTMVPLLLPFLMKLPLAHSASRLSHPHTEQLRTGLFRVNTFYHLVTVLACVVAFNFLILGLFF